MKTTQTKQINAQTPGPLFVGSPIRSTDTIGLCKSWDDGGETGEETVAEVLPGVPECAERDARLLASSYTAFDRAGRALGIDASELAESVDLAGLIEALRASEETLANLYRTGVIKTASNLSEDAKTIAVQDLLESLDAARAQLDKLPKPATP